MRPLEPLAPHTTFKIGGPADAFVSPRSVEEVSQVVCACEQASVPWRVIGCGSDLLVSDGGVEGVVIEVRDNLSAIRVDGTRIVARARVLQTQRSPRRHAPQGFRATSSPAASPAPSGARPS